ncbi:hypothetical protein F7734_51930 [Scytonema sp. UIC 10036]|uniref:hypothetical protein n=1 Tax=Scytonema sp. UIC 10036 TaxID=2304196 RepID=UPI0012DA96CD|nr:hypothetical protein [Scytonema sp. UIC 10036]MUH00336.1 hypothetical protein [Scytonema sp. UIC 10036]
MTDLNLNAQLGGRLKALQHYWNHDTASETLATVFDICVNRWGVTCPNLPQEALDKGLRVTLKQRHVTYFANMAQLAGCTVPDVARSMLIQWLCATEPTLLLPQTTLSPQKITPLPQQSTRTQAQLLPTRTKKAQKKAKQPLTVAEAAPIEVQPTRVEVEKPEQKPKFDAKASLLALKRG